jgi:hypothetical protein
MNQHFLLTLSLLTAANFAHADDAKPDLPALIECRSDMAGFMSLASLVMDDAKARENGWKPLPSINMFMAEYELPAPISVFGHSTQHIAFTSSGIIAVLDMPDPHPLAAQLGLEALVDTPQKVMFGKQVSSTETRDEDAKSTTIESVLMSVSNVTTHPGKTLAGCEYNLDYELDEDRQNPP